MSGLPPRAICPSSNIYCVPYEALRHSPVSARHIRGDLPTSLKGLVEPKRIFVIVIWGRRRRGRPALFAVCTRFAEGYVPAFIGRGKGKKPNDAMRIINRIENQQWMLWRGNMQEKGGYWDDDMAREWAEYQKCFYDARNMREPNVLRRKYRPLATILRLVRAWAEARKTRTADWHPIGAKARSHAPSKIGAYL